MHQRVMRLDAHNSLQKDKRVRRQDGLASGFLHLGQVSKSIGLGVVVVPKIPHGGKTLWCLGLYEPIMQYAGEIMNNTQYNKYTSDRKRV